MQPRMMIMICGMAMLLGGPATGWAEERETASGLTRDEQQMSEHAASPEGEQRVIQRLAGEFQVDEARVADLRAQRLGYGEIHHVLSLARQMPHGITDENVNTILRMRQQQHMGWGNISKTLQGGTQPESSESSGNMHDNGMTSPGTIGLKSGNQSLNMQGGASEPGGWNPGHSNGRSSSAPGHAR